MGVTEKKGYSLFFNLIPYFPDFLIPYFLDLTKKLRKN